MLCVQDGQLDRRRCEATFEALTSEPIEGFGQPPGDVASIAGITLRSHGECYFASKGELGCPGGSLKWKRGRRSELQHTFDEILEEWTDSMGIEGHHNPYTTRECTIGGQPAICHRVDYNGVLDAPFRVLHMAMVKDSGDDLLLHCSYTTSGPAPEPCRQAFSDAR